MKVSETCREGPCAGKRASGVARPFTFHNATPFLLHRLFFSFLLKSKHQLSPPEPILFPTLLSLQYIMLSLSVVIERRKLRQRIESNDPNLTKLTIDTRSIDYLPNYLPHDGDWARDGEGIGRNEHIKELCFGSGMASAVGRTDFEAFCSGLACNKTIEKMSIHCCELFGGEIFNMLSPFFQQNGNLHHFMFCGSVRSAPNAVLLLSESLSRFNTLREIELRGRQLRDNEIETLILALASHTSLAGIVFGGNKVGERGVAALAALLNNPRSALAELDLTNCSLNDERAVILAAAALGGNAALRKLDLSQNENITVTGWRAIFTQLHSPQSSLENLTLCASSISNAAATSLGNALANNTHLKVLHVSEMRSIAAEGWRSIFEALESPRCVLQELDLGCNNLRDGDVDYLTSSLSNNCVLSSLTLCYNEEVTASGWRALSAVLENPNSALEKIDLSYSPIDNDALVSFANALRHNNKLKELFLNANWGLREDEEGYVPITNWDALSNALCNESSINETHTSNHTLQRVVDPDSDYADESQLPQNLRILLQLNQENTKTEAARRKILKVHFSGNFNMQPFIDMDLKVLPHAVAWMARDEFGSSLSYQFVRYTTFFVGLGGINISENERGSKRQKKS